MKQHIGQSLIVTVLKYAILLIIIVVFLFPVYWLVVSSLQPSTVLMRLPPHFSFLDGSLKNYQTIFSNNKYIRYFLNSTIISFGTVSLTLIASIPAGYSLSRYRFRGRNSMLTIIMSAQMFPIVVIVITLYAFYMKWGLLNTYRGVILSDTAVALPLSVVLMKSFFDTLPRSLEEAARIDGAGRMKTLWSVMIPLTLPGMVAVCIYTFLNAWDDYLMSLVIMTKIELRTMAVGLAQSFLGEYSYDYGGLMAFSFSGSLPIVLVFIFLQKYMISGLTAGAVKG